MGNITMLLDYVFIRFGMFENLKKRNLSADGTLAAHKKLLCGLGKFFTLT